MENSRKTVALYTDHSVGALTLGEPADLVVDSPQRFVELFKLAMQDAKTQGLPVERGAGFDRLNWRWRSQGPDLIHSLISSSCVSLSWWTRVHDL